MYDEDEEYYDDFEDDEDDFLRDEEEFEDDDFADPGGNSALRAETKDNPRNLPCPTCGFPNRLTPADVARGYQCNSCADAMERGRDIVYYEDVHPEAAKAASNYWVNFHYPDGIESDGIWEKDLPKVGDTYEDKYVISKVGEIRPENDDFPESVDIWLDYDLKVK